MKMTSGRRRQERQSRALDRLLAQKNAPPYVDENGEIDARRVEAWITRREVEIAVLRERTGRKFK